MKKLLTAIAITASIGFSTAVQADDHMPLPTLAEILLSDGDDFDTNQNDFDIVTQAILACSDALTAGASDPAAELTVFLPTDKAFRILVDDVYGVSISDEMELFAAIAAALGCTTIESVLKYHVVGQALFSGDVVAAGDGFDVPTLLMAATFTTDFKGKGQIRLVDNEPALRDPILRAFDIEASNGVAHVIDRVLLPIAVITD